MIRKITLMVGVGVLAGGVLASATAEGYNLLTPNRKWYDLPVMIEFNSRHPETSITDGEYGRSAISESFFDSTWGWNGAGAGTLIDGRILDRNANMGDGRPTVQFNDPHNYCGGSCLAVTMTGYWHYRGGLEEIDDADVYYSTDTKFTSENEDPTWGSCGWNEYYIEGVNQHELGHVLGLGHSNNSNATMYATAYTCDLGQDELANDDRNGILALY